MSFAESQLSQSTKMIRLVGYILFVLASFDTIGLFFPPAFFNPVWELQVMGRLVDSVPVPLIGLVMIFFAEQTDRLRVERLPLRVLSWACLVLAVIHFAMLPLGLGNTWRVNNRNNVQIGNALSQQTIAIDNTGTKLKQASSEEELLKVIGSLVRVDPNQPPTIRDPKALREQMLKELGTTTARVKAESDATKSATLQNLLRTSAKLNLGTIASAIAYFFIWRMTSWARVKRRSRKSEPQESQPESTT